MKKPIGFMDRVEITLKNICFLFGPIHQIWLGIKTNTIPWAICAGWSLAATLVLFFKIDHFLISHSRFNNLYPYYSWLYRAYSFALTSFPFWIWAWNEVRKKREKLKTLTETFRNAGLTSKTGRVPQLISDYPIDSMTRKLRLTNAGFPMPVFKEKSNFIESQLGVFIDDVKEDREKRAVEIVYSHYPMPEKFDYSSDLTSKKFEICIGKTRAHAIKTSLESTPHFLVAGLTGGGKSTFLRQFIVHLYLKHSDSKFLLIDLKGGLEFSMFEERSNFVVVPHVMAAVEELQKIDRVLDQRMAFLKNQKCKDIDAYMKRLEGSVPMSRYFIVIDEAAEMFLAGQHAKAKDIQIARATVSRIARLGRAVGVHLVVATQRPDSRALDPQVKGNLIGVLCFQMMNDASSIAVLGNGRATDLPKVPGRAIWKNGIDMLEVQTPFLSVEAAYTLLGEPNSKTKLSNSSEPLSGMTEAQSDGLMPPQAD